MRQQLALRVSWYGSSAQVSSRTRRRGLIACPLCLANFRKIEILNRLTMSCRLWRKPQEGVQLTMLCSCIVALEPLMLACLNVLSSRPSLNELLLPQPKVQNHTYGCSANAFNCIDCGRTFDRFSVKVDSSANFTVMLHARMQALVISVCFLVCQ